MSISIHVASLFVSSCQTTFALLSIFLAPRCTETVEDDSDITRTDLYIDTDKRSNRMMVGADGDEPIQPGGPMNREYTTRNRQALVP